jgi:hypothetical protein
MKLDLKYTEIEAKIFGEASGNISVSNNSTITSVSRSGDRASIEFLFTSTYEPKVGEVRIKGNMMISDPPENVDRLLREWEESGRKNLSAEMAEDIHNAIISNCIIETVILAREIHLPSPVPMPKISMKVKEKTDEGTDSYIR